MPDYVFKGTKLCGNCGQPIEKLLCGKCLEPPAGENPKPPKKIKKNQSAAQERIDVPDVFIS